MVRYEIGNYESKFSYLKIGEGSKKAVVFPETAELTCSFIKDPLKTVKLYSMLLPKEFTVYVIGYNPEMPPEETPFTIVDRAAPFIKNKVGKAVIVGISYGGPNAICFAGKYPELVSRLLLIVSAYKVSETSGKKFILDAIERGQKGDKYGLAQQMNTLASFCLLRAVQKYITKRNKSSIEKNFNPPSTLVTAYTAAFINLTAEIKAMLPKIQAPTYIFGGTKDICFSEQDFRETAELIPNGHAVIFENAGHLVAVEKYFKFKKQFTKIILQDEE
jgi:pimeloyl-ACP methyl ester carboxylesterase